MSFLPEGPIKNALNLMNDPAFLKPPAAAECTALDDSGNQLNMLCSVFGIPSPQSPKSLIDMVKSSTPTPETMVQAQAAASSYENLMAINERMTNAPPSNKSLKTVGCEFIDTVFKAFKNAGKLVGDLVKSVAGLIGKIDLKKLLDPIGALAKKVFASGADMLKWMGTAMGPIKGAIQAAIKLLPDFSTLKKGILDTTKHISKLISSGIKTFTKWIGDGVKALSDGLKDLANTNFLASFNSFNPCLDEIKKSAVDVKKIPTGVISAIQANAGTSSTGVVGQGFSFLP